MECDKPCAENCVLLLALKAIEDKSSNQDENDFENLICFDRISFKVQCVDTDYEGVVIHS